MRILIVTPEFPPHSSGGILKYYALMSDALAAAGATVTVLVASPFSTHDNYETSSGVSVRFVPLDDVDRHAARLSHFSAAPAFRRWIGAALAAADSVRRLSDGCDIIETTDFGLLFVPLVTMADRPPLVVKMHGSTGQISEHEPVLPAAALDSALAKLAEAMLLPAADALHAISPMNAAEWAARLNVHVDVALPPLELPGERPAAPSEFSGLVAARIQSWKGPAELCAAVAALGSGLPSDLKIAWAGRDTRTAPGGGSMSDWLAARYPSVWGPRVVPIGAQPAETILAHQFSSRYIVVPSLWDTFNYALAESMGAGRVTLGSRGAGAATLIDDEANGFAIDVSDTNAFAERLLHAHSLNGEARLAIGGAARDTVGRLLNPAVAAERSLSLMKSASRRTPPPQIADWVRDFFDPHSDPQADRSFLENVGIRDLAAHLGERLLRKMSPERQ